jgi:hypothetical protein
VFRRYDIIDTQRKRDAIALVEAFAARKVAANSASLAQNDFGEADRKVDKSLKLKTKPR